MDDLRPALGGVGGRRAAAGAGLALALRLMGGAAVLSAPAVVQGWRSLRRRAGLMGGAGVLAAAAIGPVAVAEPSVARAVGGTLPALSIVLPLVAAGVVAWLGFRRRGLREAAR